MFTLLSDHQIESNNQFNFQRISYYGWRLGCTSPAKNKDLHFEKEILVYSIFVVISFRFRSQQFCGSFHNGFSQAIPSTQQLQTVQAALLSPVHTQSPNGQVPMSLPPSAAIQPAQLIEYNGVPTIVFGGGLCEQLYYSPPPSFVPASPTLSPGSAMPPSFAFSQSVALPPTPPFHSLSGQQFFSPTIEIIAQPQI